MTNLLVMKEYLKGIYGKYEVYITPLAKFLLSVVVLALINGKLGYMERLNNPALVLIISLLSSFLPINFILVAAAFFVVLHLYVMSLECALVVLALMLIMFLLYFRFSPRDTIAVLLTPLCCMLKMPLVMPLAMGLVGTPASVVSVSCGVLIYSMLQYVSESITTLNSMDAESALQKYRYLVDGILENRTMLVMVLAFAVVVIIVYVLRRLSVDYAWTIAMVAGSLIGVIVLFVGDLIFDTNISIGETVLGAVLSVAVVKLLQFFVFNVDYSRTEYVQFEDDEYYYYVKAVPKIMMTPPDKTVKKINTQKKNVAPIPHSTGTVNKTKK